MMPDCKCFECFVGVACIDGSCPIANSVEYLERGISLVRRCEDCHFYTGCAHCVFLDTDDCPLKGGKNNHVS